MLTVIWHTLRESIHRRMGLVLLVCSVFLPALIFTVSRFETRADGSVVALTGPFQHPSIQTFANDTYQSLLQFTSGVWLFLGMFAAGPLLVSYLEKGSPDLLFSKGVARWEFFLGRLIGVLGLYALAIAVMDGGSALYLWSRTGVSPQRFLLALLFPLLSFAAYLAVMGLVSLAQPNAGVLIMVAFVQATISAILATRTRLFVLIHWAWAQTTLNWLYRILPKNSELDRLAVSYFTQGTYEWWPIWSTGAFIAAALGVCFWFLHRKSF